MHLSDNLENILDFAIFHQLDASPALLLLTFCSMKPELMLKYKVQYNVNVFLWLLCKTLPICGGWLGWDWIENRVPAPKGPSWPQLMVTDCVRKDSQFQIFIHLRLQEDTAQYTLSFYEQLESWWMSEMPTPRLPTSRHTWYLLFFLHGQNFWKIKFTPKFTK